MEYADADKPASAPPEGGAKGLDWRLVRFLLTHLIIGTVSGWIFVAALIWFDIGGLGSLVTGSSVGPMAVIMLMIVMMITWGAGSMGTAVFLLPRKEEDDDKGKPMPLFPLRLQPARANAPRRR
ncbi:hypothetical protein [Hyphococcus luteus]|uniref:Glucan biosynthesis glucosyltransferase H n=1 Tax=Hyphococcus luteus TaxID=2058213 RepID=A0A2S7K4L6_9PROT|nr:hypothetical protein [Marinicaulis flavus]PQA87450.1 hypothetical protein CW354_11635 [Marinicaulis flavus]